MSLGSRLRQLESGTPVPVATNEPSVDPTRSDHAERPAAPAAPSPIEELKNRARAALVGGIGPELSKQDLSTSQLRKAVCDELGRLVERDRIPLSPEERQQVITDVTNDVLGFGPIEPLLADQAVSEIMVNGTDAIYVEQNGRLTLSEARFHSEEHLRQVIDRIVAQVGRRIDESSPMVDARLADGSRVNAIVPPLAVDGSVLTIRKFSKDGLTAGDLVDKGSLTEQSLRVLEGCIRGRLNILVSGGTGTGKTTFLNVLSSFIPEGDRIVTIEDAVELRLRQRHVIRLECRPPNVEGRGAVTTRELVKNALRMRPDRIIVGECRGAEALDMLQAMNTGHEGSLSTLHANTPRDGLSRLETMVLMTGVELPARAIREQMASAVDLVVQLTRTRSGARIVSRITEVAGMEGEMVTTNDLFAIVGATSDDEGQLTPTGILPQCTEKLATHGVTLPGSLFDPASGVSRGGLR